MKTYLYIADTEQLKDGALFKRLYELLPEYRKEKIDRLKIENDKRLSLAAGILLKTALEENGILSGGAEIAFGERGKPFIPGREDIRFNLSHSGTKALCIISEHEVGCDVERLREYNSSLASYICSQKQFEAIEALPEAERAEAFTQLWTMKESYMKATGKGIGIRASSVDFPIKNYKIFSYDPVDGHCISCCIDQSAADKPELKEIDLRKTP